MMLLHTAIGSVAAGTGARIVATETHAGLALWAISIHLTFIAVASNKGCWIARQALGANASSLAIASNNAVSIGSTGIGIAYSSAWFNAALVGISGIARAAVALLAIARHVTVSVAATWTRLAQLNRNGWLFANPEGISNLVIRAIADRLT